MPFPAETTAWRRTSLDDVGLLWSSQPYSSAIPDAAELQVARSMNEAWLPASPILALLLDLRTLTVAQCTRNSAEVLGFGHDLLMREGFRFYIDRVDTADRDRALLVYKEAYQHYHTITPSLRKYHRFSLCYRFRHGATGAPIWLLHQSIPALIDTTGSLVFTLNLITDITPFKADSTAGGRFYVPTSSQGLQEIRIPTDEQLTRVLTKREKQIIKMLMEGMSSKQIAQSLTISANTVNNHRKRLLGKTGCNNSMELVRYAMENGLV
jgi:DNA-binding CsgD family transcriptional regulator